MDERLVSELVLLLRTPSVRRDRARAVKELPRLTELARVVSPANANKSEITHINRLLNAAVARSKPRYLRRALLAYWGLPPYGALDSAEDRQASAAAVWAEDFASLPRTEKVAAARRPAAANTLRSQRYKQFFAETLAEGVTAVVAQVGGDRRSAYVDTDGDDRHRPKLPVAVTLERRTSVWLDDAGRKFRVRYEQRTMAMTRTNGIQRLIVSDGSPGYRVQVRNCDGCELVDEEELNNNMRRLVLHMPAQEPGEEWVHSYELHTDFDDAAPRPDGGEVFTDEINDDFEARIIVYFGERHPQLAWYFDDLPRPLVPGEPRTNNVLGLDSKNRLAWNFFPPTNARKCYGLVWQFQTGDKE